MKRVAHGEPDIQKPGTSCELPGFFVILSTAYIAADDKKYQGLLYFLCYDHPRLTNPSDFTIILE